MTYRGYIAPEYLSKGEISFKADIYSLGIIIKKILRGSNDLSDFEKVWTKLTIFFLFRVTPYYPAIIAQETRGALATYPFDFWELVHNQEIHERA